jgi:glucokinase
MWPPIGEEPGSVDVLCGDIGGTNTRLAILSGGRFSKLASDTLRSVDFPDLETAVAHFLTHAGARFEAAAFGVAGPIVDGHCVLTNLDWEVDVEVLRRRLDVAKVVLLNDLEAQARGIGWVEPGGIYCLHAGEPRPGNMALIAAGTGLGEAGIYFDGRRHWPFATEGGHTDFSPRSELQIELLRFMWQRPDRVSWERLVSGMGILNLFEFFVGRGLEPALDYPTGPGRVAAISAAGLSGSCPVATRTLELFVELYAAEAGNLALKAMAVAGVYLGGGIAPRILDHLRGEAFWRSFCDKGRMRPLLEKIPVRVILDQDAAL